MNLTLDVFKGLVLLLLLVLLLMFSLPSWQNDPALAAPALTSPALALAANGEATFSGTGEPGTEVQVLANGEVVGQTQVQEDGTWSLTTKLDKPEQTEIELQTLDADGQVVATSDPIELDVTETALDESQSADGDSQAASDEADSAADSADSDSQAASDEADSADGDSQAASDEADSADSDSQAASDEADSADGDSQAASDEADSAADSADGDSQAASDEADSAADSADGDSQAASDEADNADGDSQAASDEADSADGDSQAASDEADSADGDSQAASDEADSADGDSQAASNEADSADGDSQAASDEADSADGDSQAASDETQSADGEQEITISIPTLLLTGIAFVDDEVTFVGTGVPGSDVEILVDGQIVGQSQIEDDGVWILSTKLDQQDEVEIQALMITDDEVVAVSERVVLNLATSATEVDLPFLISPTLITTGDVVFGGIGAPDAQLQLVINGQAVGQTQIEPDGTWSLSTQLDQAGEIEVQVQLIDAEGQVIVTTEPLTLTVTEATGE